MNEGVSIVVAKKEKEIVNSARLALKERLYVSGWQLSGWLQQAKFHPGSVYAIGIAYRVEIPIGVIFCFKDEISGVFVRKSERRQGVGTQLVEAVCDVSNDFVPKFTHHDARSQEFFESIERNIDLDAW